VVTGRTVFASTPEAPASDGQMPDTMYFKRGETEPERAGVAGRRPPTMNESIQAPATRAAAEERAPPAAAPVPAVQPGREAPVSLEPVKSSNTTVIIVVVAAAVAAGVAALLFLL
jgi:hypothetical protein